MKARMRLAALTACVTLLTVVAFGRALGAPFFWDDRALILANPYLGRADGLVRFFSPAFWQSISCPDDYRPFEMFSYSLDYLVWEKNPLGYHLTNILLHIFNCAAVYLLLAPLARSARVAAAASVLFALHPMHGEAIIWIQNRSELLCAALSLVTLIAFARSAREAPRPLRWLSCAAFALAVLTKESALAVPFLCATLLAFSRPRSRKGALTLLATLAGIGTVACVLKLCILRQGRFADAYPLHEGGVTYMFSVMKTMAVYLTMHVLPVNFSLARPFSIPTPDQPAAPLFCSAVVLFTAACALLLCLRKKPSGAALAFMLIALLPASNIVYLASRPISEQRIYFPSIGFCFFLALLLKGIARERPARVFGTVFLIAITLAYLTIAMARADYWRDEQVLWERTLEAAPSAARAKLYLARIYREQGRYDESIGLIKSGLRDTTPGYAPLFVELGRTYDALGWHESSLRQFERAVAFEPAYLHARLSLAAAYRRLGRYAEALEQFTFIERTWPGCERGKLGAANVQRDQGNYAAAMKKIGELLALSPENPQVIANAALVRSDEGRYAEAEQLFRRAVRLDPRSGAIRNDYGLFLARRGRHDEAIEQYREALRLEPDKWLPHRNLARSYLAKGKGVESLVELMRAAQSQPDREDILAEINRLSDELGQKPIPVALLASVVNEHCVLLNRRGIYCARIGNEDGAIECFIKLCALQPRNGEARANLGRIYAQRGEYARALEELQVAARLLPDEPSVYSSLGTCYAAVGRLDDARHAWERARSLNPRAREPRRNLARIRRRNKPLLISPRRAESILYP
jgi:tetratricopeptide (TPR) repeat protein